MIIRDYQISKQTKQEVESSIFCLQILSMYTEVTKRKSLMMREEYGLKGYEQETQRRKKPEVANKHAKILNFTSQGNGEWNH